MLFAQMFSCIPRRKCSTKSRRSRKAKKSSSLSSQKKLKTRLTKPISSLINKMLKRKSKVKEDSSPPMPTINNSSSLNSIVAHASLSPASHERVESRDQFQHTIIHVTPANESTTTNKLIPKVELSRKRPVKITRASILRRECTSLPSLLPYTHRHRLPSPLRRSYCVSRQSLRSCSAQPEMVPLPLSTKAEVHCKTSPRDFSLSKPKDAISVASSGSISLSSSVSSLSNLNQECFTLASRPLSKDGIAYEIIFSAPSVHCRFTPHPQFGPDYTYSFSKSADLEEDDDDWNTDGEFEDSDIEEEEEDTVSPKSECTCKCGVFFTAAKPPLPPSALDRIRRYRQYKQN